MNNINTEDEQYKSFKTIYKEEFIKFCENTTIRGVPKIAKARKTHIRYLWLTFFLLLFVGFLVCIIFLCFQYTSYDVIHPPRIIIDRKAPFPSLTVCNFRPMARNIVNIMREINIKDPREFAQSINNYAINYYYRKHLIENYQRTSSVMTMGAYLESLPNQTFSKLGHKPEDLIIHCLITYMNGSSPQSNSCEKLGNWSLIQHAQYINCYTFNLDPKYSSLTNALEFYFYLDEGLPQKMCMDCFSSDVKSQLSGALILIHRRLTFPNFNHDTINLQPGTLTEIKLKIFQNIHKEPPYGSCSRKAPKDIPLYNYIYSYSYFSCKQLTIQHDINRQCGCNAIEYPIDNYNLPFCSYLPRFIEKDKCSKDTSDQNCKRQLDTVLKKIVCKANVSAQYEMEISKNCPYLCNTYSYESDRSTSSWPTKTWQMKWLQSKAAAKLVEKPELKVYKEAHELYKKGNVTQSFNILNQQNILEQNLLAVIINRPNHNVHRVEEKEVLSLTSFLSQVGGLCSMWIGLTLIIIVEIIEMLLNCFSKLKSSRKKGFIHKSQVLHKNAEDLEKPKEFKNSYWMTSDTEL